MTYRSAALGPNWQPALDVCETEDAYQIQIEVPGVAREQITVDLNENVLTIAGEKVRPYEAKSTRMHRIERGYGAFERRISLPDDIDPDEVEAVLEQGVLKLRVGKRRAGVAIRIPVNRTRGETP